MLDKKDLPRKYVARFYTGMGVSLVEAGFLNKVMLTEAAVPRMPRRPVLIPAVLAMLTIFQPWCPASRAEEPGSAAANPTTAAAALPVVLAIDVLKSAAGTQITISGEGNLAYEYFVIGGKSLLIDIPGASSKVWPAERMVADGFVSRIQVAEHTGEKPGVRVALALTTPDDFTVRGESGRIVVVFAKRNDRASPSQPPLNRVVEITAARIANAFRVAVKTDAKPSYRVVASSDPKKITVAIDGSRLEPNSRTTSEYAGLDTPVTRISTRVEPTDPPVVLVTIDLREPLPFRVFTDESGLNVDLSIAFPPPEPTAARAANQVPLKADQRGASQFAATPSPSTSALMPAPATVSSQHAQAEAGYTGGKITIDFVDADLRDILLLISNTSGRNFIFSEDVRGKRTLRLEQVPWDQALDMILKTNIPPLTKILEPNNIIRIADKAEIEKKAEAEIALASKKAEAELALANRKVEAEILLASKKTEAESKERINNEIRLQEEERQSRRTAILQGKRIFEDKDYPEAQLVEKTFLISYASFDDIINGIRALNARFDKQYSSTSEIPAAVAREIQAESPSSSPKPFTGNRSGTRNESRSETKSEGAFQFRAQATYNEAVQLEYESCPGCIFQFDERTSSLYIRTYPYFLDQYEKIINALDKPTPSIIIEARIVEVQDGYTQNLGIQWGADFTADAAHGNALPYAFPNSIAVAGTESTSTGNYMVNLPVVGALGGIGISLGHVADIFSLDMRLSALERLGKTKLLSNPKILTQQNAEAIIQIGDELPVVSSSISENITTTSIDWKKVGLRLFVKPRATFDNRVMLDVFIEKSRRGVNVTTTEGENFSITSNTIETKVLIENGSTAVIGGLFTENTSNESDGIPGLSNIPFFGWLFKSKRDSSSRTELLVFLTPRLVDSASLSTK